MTIQFFDLFNSAPKDEQNYEKLKLLLKTKLKLNNI